MKGLRKSCRRSDNITSLLPNLVKPAPELPRLANTPNRRAHRGILEATPRIELGMELLQSSALPLGYVAARFVILATSIAGAPGVGFRGIYCRPRARLYIQLAATSTLYLEEPPYGRVHDQDAPAW